MANVSKSPAYRVMNGPHEFTIVGIIKDWERRAELPCIKVPTLITAGQFDEAVIECQQSIQYGIAGSRLEILRGCSHLTMLEQPEQFNALVRGFIA